MKMKTEKATETRKDKLLQELALYIAQKSIGDESFGATKLNKLLFYSDFLAFLNFGKSITGSDYFRLANGPAPRRWIPVRKGMLDSGDAIMLQSEFHGFPQHRLIPRRPAHLGEFTPEQIALVDKVINLHRGKTAAEISDESHDFVGWRLAADQETIPYQVARISRHPISQERIEYGSGLDALAKSALEANA